LARRRTARKWEGMKKEHKNNGNLKISKKMGGRGEYGE